MDVICTAGHVDHGKSSLVRALTGMEPDRFEEERRRGLTIDLGFGWSAMGEGAAARTVAFVDLPGHERFIGNMLAGAGPVESTLFVVAADEGWKPQSQEHLDILDLLEVRSGVIAITKRDAVDAGTLRATTADVRERVAATSLHDAPVVAVSATTGEGLDALRTALLETLRRRPAPPDRGRPRLWVDRRFTVKGAGTVVTGTLWGGHLDVGDDVTLLPGTLRARVRGIQSLMQNVDRAQPGARVALNLAGVDRDEVTRGDAVVLSGQWVTTSVMDAWVRALPGQEIGRRGAWHVHAGAGEWLAQVRPLPAGTIHGNGYARLTLRTPAPLGAGDRFVLREAGRRATAGGGIVLDPLTATLPPGIDAATRVEQLRARHEALGAGGAAALLRLHVGERGAAALAEASAAVALPPSSDPVAGTGLLPLGGAVAHPKAVAAWSAAIGQALMRHHEAHPVDRAAPRDLAVRAAVGAGCPGDSAGPLLDVLIRLGRVVAEGRGIRHPAHEVRLDPAQQRARDALLTALDVSPFSPPGLAAAATAAGAPPALVRELEQAGTLVRLGPDLVITAEAMKSAAQRLRGAYLAEGPLTAARAKEALQTTRKYAVPLLEELDRRGITRRRGDVRDVP